MKTLLLLLPFVFTSFNTKPKEITSNQVLITERGAGQITIAQNTKRI